MRIDPRRVAAAAALAWLAGCAGPAPAPGGGAVALPEQGIVVRALRLSAHGYILDLRYRVTDAKKAARLLDGHNKVELLDPAHGAELGVAESPVIGAMRQTSRNHAVYTDRDYFVLFTNPGRAVRAGDSVRLAVNGQVVAPLTVN
ncbi:MAG: hypothetical protein ACXWC4_02565 [Telluria sp.]